MKHRYLASPGRIFLLAVLSCTALHAQAQDAPGDHLAVTTDWDGDRTPDAFRVVDDGTDAVRLQVRLSRGHTLTSNALSNCCSHIEVSGGGPVKLTSKGMRGFSYYTFRYNAAAGDFQLIGFDTESFGNAMNDGAGTSSLNLLNGAFIASYQTYNEKLQKLVTLPKVQKKLILRRTYYLRDFGDVSEEQISTLIHDNNPKAVR